MKGKVIVKQIKSTCGYGKDVKNTLSALGLGKIGKSRNFDLNPAIWGMLRRVRNLIDVYQTK
jgi:large subunit ribosomal protein L30